MLCDVFENFRNSSLKDYGLSPIQYLSASAVTWDIMLNMTKVELELISDADMYVFFKNGTRNGGTYISRRYSNANHKYLKSYDPNQESNHILRRK